MSSATFWRMGRWRMAGIIALRRAAGPPWPPGSPEEQQRHLPDQVVRVEGLPEEGSGPSPWPQRLGQLDVVSRDEEDREVGPALPQPPAQLPPVHHGHADVGDEEIDRAVQSEAQGLLAVVRGIHLMALL